MEAHTPIEDLRQRVVGIVLVTRKRKGIAAFQAHCLLILEQRFAASRANARVEEIEDAIKPIAEGH